MKLTKKRGLWAGIVSIVSAGLVWAASIFTPHPTTGSGSAPPTAVWIPASTDFGPVEIGAPPAARTVRLKNVAKTGNLSGVVKLSTSCPAGIFAITAGGGAYTLGPGQSRNVTITFAPTDTLATYTCEILCTP